MAITYPTTLDALTNPTAANNLDSATVPHATQHADANDAIEAIEAELGTLPKGSFGTVKLRLDSLAPLASPTFTGTVVAPAITGLVTITPSGAAVIGLIVKGAASQSARLQEWQNSTGVDVVNISAGGNLTVSGDIITGSKITDGTYSGSFLTVSPSSPVLVTSRGAAIVGMTVKGAASQTANLQEWQNSAGTVLASISSAGDIRASYIANASNNNVYLQMGGNSPTFTNRDSVGNVGLIVKGMAGQTGNLQEWQNSSGTVLGRVTVNSEFYLNNGTFGGSSIGITNTSSGGTLYINSGSGGTAGDFVFRVSSSYTPVAIMGPTGILSQGTTAGAPTIASAGTIAPVTAIVFVSGTTTINTITAPAPISTNGGSIVIIPTGMFLTGVTGNIALASTSVANKALRMTYDPITTKWYPSY